MSDIRHQCEVRELLRMKCKSPASIDTYLKEVIEKRGQAARDRLNDDAVDQWMKGNRGEFGDWR